jgi:hypothetical protein
VTRDAELLAKALQDAVNAAPDTRRMTLTLLRLMGVENPEEWVR